MPRRRNARKAPELEREPLDEYSVWDKRIGKTFYYSLIVASIIVVMGIWLGIIDLLIVTGNLEFFISLELGFQIAIIGAIITGHLFLLILFYILFRGGLLKLCHVLFKDRKVARKYEDYSTLRWLLAILLMAVYITIFGLIIAIIPSIIFQGIAQLWIWMIQSLVFWQWVVTIGIIAFIIIGFSLAGFALWNHGVYAVLRRVKQIDEEIEVEERIKIENLQDADEETLQKAYRQETGKRAIYRGKETKGYIAWKKKIKG